MQSCKQFVQSVKELMEFTKLVKVRMLFTVKFLLNNKSGIIYLHLQKGYKKYLKN